MKSKHRGPPKLTSKTAEATGYSERTARVNVAEKLEISGAAFTSPPKRYKVEEGYNFFNTEALRRLFHNFYCE